MKFNSGCATTLNLTLTQRGTTQRRYDTRASIRLIASAITLSVGVIMLNVIAEAISMQLT